MGRPKKNGSYVPLGANYFMDDAVMEAGPEAELLFVRVLSFLASVPHTDGYITERQVRSIAGSGLRNVTRRLQDLERSGLLEARSGGFVARSWLKWNRSAQEIGRAQARDRERKTLKVGDSADIPSGIQPESGVNPAHISDTDQISTSLPKGSEPRKRGTRIPDDFTVTPEMVEWARLNAPDVDGRRSTQMFINHWRAKTGRDATKLDWPATWRNWMLRDQENAQRNTGRLTRDEENLAVVARLAAREQHMEGIEA